MSDALFDSMFIIVPFLITIFFIVFFIVVILQIVKGIKTWNKNNNSLKLTVDAKIVDKHEKVSHHHHQNSSSTSSSYYVTFEVESGDRIELKVQSHEYGYLIVNDLGKLTFQGTRYLGFVRNK